MNCLQAGIPSLKTNRDKIHNISLLYRGGNTLISFTGIIFNIYDNMIYFLLCSLILDLTMVCVGLCKFFVFVFCFYVFVVVVVVVFFFFFFF